MSINGAAPRRNLLILQCDTDDLARQDLFPVLAASASYWHIAEVPP